MTINSPSGYLQEAKHISSVLLSCYATVLRDNQLILPYVLNRMTTVDHLQEINEIIVFARLFIYTTPEPNDEEDWQQITRIVNVKTSQYGLIPPWTEEETKQNYTALKDIPFYEVYFQKWEGKDKNDLGVKEKMRSLQNSMDLGAGNRAITSG